MTSTWTQPDPNVPFSIGGYAFFGRLTDVDGATTEFELAQSYLANLPAGKYRLEIWTVSQSDAVGVEIVPGGTARIHRDFGPVDSSCVRDVEVPAGEIVELVYRATVGSCELAPAG